MVRCCLWCYLMPSWYYSVLAGGPLILVCDVKLCSVTLHSPLSTLSVRQLSHCLPCWALSRGLWSVPSQHQQHQQQQQHTGPTGSLRQGTTTTAVSPHCWAGWLVVVVVGSPTVSEGCQSMSACWSPVLHLRMSAPSSLPSWGRQLLPLSRLSPSYLLSSY